MEHLEFCRFIKMAEINYKNRPDYLEGLTRGLRRAYHGEKFGTLDEHETWLALSRGADNASKERGRGYRDGLYIGGGYRDGLYIGGGDQSQEQTEKPKSFSPSIDQIRALMAEHSLTGSQAAKLAYLSGGQAFRKYLGGASPHRMSGAVWFTLIAKTTLPPETVAEIEKKMLGDSK